eukprot:TRINITY_DN4531_c0_g1_i1.p2 TRINITY_DN4531_c0_g1~~TRINITY_DN4531_c0_g1_i1.p2  ORF type:complete len:253 (-),score=45.28 TRINITY_DN4531_c0_g1_i1:2598-3356(-)
MHNHRPGSKQHAKFQWSLRAKIIISVVAGTLVVALTVGLAVGISSTNRKRGDTPVKEDVPEQQQSIEDIEKEIQEEFQNLSPGQVIPRPRPIIVSPAPQVVVPTPSPQGLDPGSSAWLTAHNDRRAKHCNTPPLQWSGALAKTAQQWANKCQFEHSDRGGENLYMISGGFKGVDADRVLYQFYDNEITKYDFNNPDFSFETGHFTQVVWRNSEEVGCATKNCGSFALVVCHYEPKGNVLGRFGQQVGDVCSP